MFVCLLGEKWPALTPIRFRAKTSARPGRPGIRNYFHENCSNYMQQCLAITVKEDMYIASKIGNDIISLLCQLLCQRNSDHNNFPS